MDTKLSIGPSINYFINHFRYWKDWKSSTILIDPSMKIIAFFDRGTSNITAVQTETYWNEQFYFECLGDYKEMETKKHIGTKKYKPMWYKFEIEKHREEISKLEQAIKTSSDPLLKTKWRDQLSFIKDTVTEEVVEYNKTYFIRLKEWQT